MAKALACSTRHDTQTLVAPRHGLVYIEHLILLIGGCLELQLSKQNSKLRSCTHAKGLLW